MATDRELEERLDACRQQTRKFWDDGAGRDLADYYGRYVEKFLPVEMELAQERHRLPGLQALHGGRCDILVLLVGHSFEPLLQAICAYQPGAILPILNRSYGSQLSGTRMYLYLEVLIRQLKARGLVAPEVQLRKSTPLPEDTPSAVFRHLLEELKSYWTASLVIDITGAKKSMVAGAFFFAAYCNAPISYVDFDNYDRSYGRPYGCDCLIGLIDNPYRDFYLRDWARVRRLYEQYAFASACEVLTSICGEMERSGFYDETEHCAARVLLQALRFYQAWDNGDYYAARQESADLPLPECAIPWAVRVLGEEWPHAATGVTADKAASMILDAHYQLKYGRTDPPGAPDFDLHRSIFARPEVLLAYVEDELAKVRRLLSPKEDYRAAYLRATGLDEFLLKARLALCWMGGDFAKDGSPIAAGTGMNEQARRWFKVLADHDGLDAMRSVLLRKLPFLRLEDKGSRKDSAEVMLTAGAPWLDAYWMNTGLAGSVEWHWPASVVSRLRGEAIHTHLYLTQAVATAAVDVADASVEEFKRNWLRRYHPTAAVNGDNRPTEAPSWTELCGWCGIDFLPPYREEESEEDEG